MIQGTSLGGLAASWGRAHEVHAQAGSRFPLKEPVLVRVFTPNPSLSWKNDAQKPPPQLSFPLLGASSGAGLTGPSHSVSSSPVLTCVATSSCD